MAALSTMLPFDQMINKWASQLNPILSNPMINPRILTQITLINGSTTINHGLDRTLQGWMILDINAAVTVYRSAPLNDKTLTLTSNGAATITLGVF